MTYSHELILTNDVDMTFKAIISDLEFEIKMEKLRSLSEGSSVFKSIQAKNDGCINGLERAIQIIEKHKIKYNTKLG